VWRKAPCQADAHDPPLWDERETVVRWPFRDVWPGVEGCSDDRDAVGKGDGVMVPMHLEELMVMAVGPALGRFRFLVQGQSALSAEHDLFCSTTLEIREGRPISVWIQAGVRGERLRTPSPGVP
jgi:hypothetical protein